MSYRFKSRYRYQNKIRNWRVTKMEYNFNISICFKGTINDSWRFLLIPRIYWEQLDERLKECFDPFTPDYVSILSDVSNVTRTKTVEILGQNFKVYQTEEEVGFDEDDGDEVIKLLSGYFITEFDDRFRYLDGLELPLLRLPYENEIPMNFVKNC